MRVLHFCALPLFSGLEQYALTLVTRQRALGVDAQMVVLQNSLLLKECQQREIPIHIVDLEFQKKNLLSAARQYHSILEKLADVDVLHLHTTHDIARLATAFWIFRARRPLGKIIQQNHIWISHSKRDPIHRLTYKIVDEIWCSSEPARQDLERYLPVEKEKIRVVKYGRDLSSARNMLSREVARQELKLPIDVVVLGAIARLDRGKGIRELLDGALANFASHPSLHLAVIGGPTMSDPQSIRFSDELIQFIATLPENHRARLHFLGSIPDAGRFLRAFDVYAQVAYKETFSLALLDAQLAERPVIGTASGGTPEVVRENQTGWLCEPEDANSLAAALDRALRENQKWAEFGQRARVRVENEFDIDVVLRDILDRYQKH